MSGSTSTSKRQQERVPARHQRDHGDGAEHRPRQRQHDRPVEPPRPAAVDRRRVLQLLRHGAEERAHDDDRDRQQERGLRQCHAERIAEQPGLAQHDEQRQDRDRDREQQPEREQPVDELAPPEPVAGQHERRQRRSRQHEGRRQQRDQRAVPDLAPERAHLEDGRVVAEHPRVGEPDRLGDELLVRAESAEPREHERHDHDAEHDERDEVEQRSLDRARLDASPPRWRGRIRTMRQPTRPVPCRSRRRAKRWYSRATISDSTKITIETALA